MFEDTNGGTQAGPGTVVGANVKLTGTISDVNDIVVHGTVEGEIISEKTVTITETASVKGPVTAQLISVSGKINGAVTAHQKLELQPTADVTGSLATQELIIKSGALFNGKSTMNKEGTAKSTQSKSGTKNDDAKSQLKDTFQPSNASPTSDPIQLPAVTLPTAPAVEIEE